MVAVLLPGIYVLLKWKHETRIGRKLSMLADANYKNIDSSHHNDNYLSVDVAKKVSSTHIFAQKIVFSVSSIARQHALKNIQRASHNTGKKKGPSISKAAKKFPVLNALRGATFSHGSLRRLRESNSMHTLAGVFFRC